MLNRFLTVFASLLATPLAAFAEAAGHAEGAHSAKTAAGAAGAAGAHESPGLLTTDVQTIIWVIVIFVLMLIILYPTAWKNVLAGLKARESRIRKDISDAEATRSRAEGTLKEYQARLDKAQDEIRELLQKANVDAERMASQIRARGQQEAEEAKERATRDIEAAHKNAVSDIYAQAADLSTQIASKILRRNLNADDQRELVRSSLEQLQNVNRG